MNSTIECCIKVYEEKQRDEPTVSDHKKIIISLLVLFLFYDEL